MSFNGRRPTPSPLPKQLSPLNYTPGGSPTSAAAADASMDSLGRKPAVNSSVATFRKNGELFAITHQHAATGYKSQPIQGVRFEGVSTYKASYQDRGSNPNAKVLSPYSASAPRNTMPVVFETSTKVKQRNSGNAANNPLAAGQTNESTRFSTTHKKAFVHHKGAMVGFSNQGIVSEKSKWAHKRLAD